MRVGYFVVSETENNVINYCNFKTLDEKAIYLYQKVSKEKNDTISTK